MYVATPYKEYTPSNGLGSADSGADVDGNAMKEKMLVISETFVFSVAGSVVSYTVVVCILVVSPADEVASVVRLVVGSTDVVAEQLILYQLLSSEK